MDDASAITKDETTGQVLKESKTSIECLREAKPSHDISIKNDNPQTEIAPDKKPQSEPLKTKVQDEISTKPNPLDESSKTKEYVAEIAPDQKNPRESSEPNAKDGIAKIETVFEKLEVNSEKTDSTTDSSVSGKEKETPEIKEANEELLKIEVENRSQPKIAVPPLNFEIKGRLGEPQNDIFATGTQSTGNLYSVNGTPSGRISRRRDSTTNVFPVGCMGCKEEIPLDAKPSPRRFLDPNEASKDLAGHLDSVPRKRPSSGRPDIQRNPVTGTGMEANVDSRRQMIRRKDGNPLLGTGYEEATKSSPSSGRIPPGGYSKGLW